MPLYHVIFTIIIFLTYLIYPFLMYDLIILLIFLTLTTIYVHYVKVHQYKWWQIKISPKVFDINLWMKENPLESSFLWSQRQFDNNTDTVFDNEIKKYVKKGHKVILWVHNNPIGIYAFGEVLEDPFVSEIVRDMKYYSIIKKREVSNVHLKIGFKRIFLNDPIDNHQLYETHLSRYTESIFDLLLNRDLPKRLPVLTKGSLEQLTSTASSHGKIDSWSWIPFKSLNLEIGNKLESLYMT